MLQALRAIREPTSLFTGVEIYTLLTLRSSLEKLMLVRVHR